MIPHLLILIFCSLLSVSLARISPPFRHKPGSNEAPLFKNGCQVIGRPYRSLVDEQHRARCMIQDKASHMSYRLWSKSGPPKCWRARTNDDQIGIPLRSTLDDLSLWPSFTRERFRLGNVA